MNIDTMLTQAGYPPAGPIELAALDKALKHEWRDWARACAADPQNSQHREQLRSAMLAVTPVVRALLAGMEVWQPAEVRISTLVEAGRPLRAAIAALIRESSTDTQRTTAINFVKEAFDKKQRSAPSTPAPSSGILADKIHHVYATKAAVTIEAATTAEGRSCLQIEAAPRVEGGSSYDWTRKIIIQLGEGETLQMLAVLRGWSQEIEIDNHGSERDKRMTFARQKDGKAGFLVSVRQGSVARLVPIPAFESFRISSLILRVLTRNSPHLNAELIAEMARELAEQ